MTQSTHIPFISQHEIYHFGLDMLELFGDYRNEGEFTGLDFDNSNFGTIEEFGISKHEVNNYLYKIQFSINDTPLFAFYKGNKNDHNYNGSVKTENYFCYYAGAFHLYGEEGVIDFINRFARIKRGDCIKRFDLCMDIPFTTSDVYSTFEKIDQKKTIYFGKNNEVETLYIGEKQSTKNKHSLIRVYNKLLDLYKKGKVQLYSEYFEYDRMTRLEIEVRRELAKNVRLEELFILDNQLDIFMSNLSKHTILFDNFTHNKVSLFRKRVSKDWETMSGIEKTQRIKLFLAYAEKISVTLGLCPIQILLKKNVFHANTLDMIEKYGVRGLIKEIHLQRHWRTKINNILDRQSLYDSGKRP